MRQNFVICSSLQQEEEQRAIILEHVEYQEAMLTNVPIPLYDVRVLPDSLDYFEKETIALGYKSSLTVQQLYNFFITQMERYGWKHLVSFENEKIHLLFKNPDSYCCIVLQEIENLTSIAIYIKRACL